METHLMVRMRQGYVFSKLNVLRSYPKGNEITHLYLSHLFVSISLNLYCILHFSVTCGVGVAL